MESYSKFERLVARSLESKPRIRNTLKFAYHRVNYLLHKESNFSFEIHPDVTISEPNEWAGSNCQNNFNSLFFGYYDKSPWSQDMNCLLLHYLMKGRKEIGLIIYNSELGITKKVADSRAWNWQQGAMLQWLPSHSNKIIYNDIIDNRLISCIKDIESEYEKNLTFPIQVVHPSGKEALSLNYRKLDKLRPDYGYGYPVQNFKGDQELTKDGIWKLDLESGNANLIISLDSLIDIQPRSEMINAEHKVNHCLYSPNGKRFVFMHRWFGQKGKFSRLLAANENGKEIKILLDDRMVSHYSWKDNSNLIAWARTEESGDRYYVINVESGRKKILGKDVLDQFGDGHPSFSLNGEWLITDTYPDKARQRHLLLFHLKEKKVIKLGRFYSPWKFDGVKRCDLHPRWSPDGNWISIDSAHNGKRNTYLINVSEIVN